MNAIYSKLKKVMGTRCTRLAHPFTFVILASMLLLQSCNYLDVVPVEQPGVDDMMADANDVRDMLYSCYGYIQNENCDMPNPKMIDGMADDLVEPQEWQDLSELSQWNTLTPTAAKTANSQYPWKIWYNAIGYCNLFLQQIEKVHFHFSSEVKKQYVAETNFLKAYYHFRALETYGPIPLIDKVQNSNISKSDIPGRSHFDYCVRYIDSLLNAASANLPDKYANTTDYGRATSVMCKALSARMHVLAASPLWNGNFPDRTWKNTKYQTPGYGYELVSHTYDATKWETAREACKKAIEAAEAAGHRLFTVDDAEILRANDNIPLPEVPNCSDDEFKKKVMTMRYLMATRPDHGNTEVIWGVEPKASDFGNDWYAISSMPSYIGTSNIGTRVGGWGGLSATLFTVEHFFTKNGLQPKEDLDFTPEGDWFKSAGLSNTDVINLCVGREPRFYAWISFDGDEYSPIMVNHSPLIIHMRVGTYQGYDTSIHGTRNYSPTGFLNKKWVSPQIYYTLEGSAHNHNDLYYPKCMMRLAEFYLDLAECDAHLGSQYQEEALTYLNKIRERAGVPDVTTETMTQTGKTLLQIVLDERFVELYAEHSRYYDIRRYVEGPKYLSKSCFWGLNAIRTNPTFEEFNTPTPIDQSFSWNNRQYLVPVQSTELYSNPQMVQAPGY